MRIMRVEGDEGKGDENDDKEGDENDDKEGDERASMTTEPSHH